MRTSQFTGRVRVALLGLIACGLWALPGCTATPVMKIESDAKEVTPQDAKHPVKSGPAVSETPLCGNSPKAINHYSCAKGYSSY